MPSLRNCHLILGAVGLLFFLLTGQYMARVAGVPELAVGERTLYRAGHIYLLLACVANVFAGAAMKAGEKTGLIQRLCSILLMVSLILLGWSFMAEVPTGELERPAARLALYLCFGAATALVLRAAFNAYLERTGPPD